MPKIFQNIQSIFQLKEHLKDHFNYKMFLIDW